MAGWYHQDGELTRTSSLFSFTVVNDLHVCLLILPCQLVNVCKSALINPLRSPFNYYHQC
jgi:hypothetical protein